MCSGRRRRDLALVHAGVPPGHAADPKLPEVGQRDVEGGEPLVGCVGVAAHREQVYVPVSHPRYLQ